MARKPDYQMSDSADEVARASGLHESEVTTSVAMSSRESQGSLEMRQELEALTVKELRGKAKELSVSLR
ncbi:MAG: hypothetical protein V3W22_06130, partial [Thermoplasmata archaeon]